MMFSPAVDKINAVVQIHPQTPLSIGEIQRLAGIKNYQAAKDALASLAKRGLVVEGFRANKPTFEPDLRSRYLVAARVAGLVALPWIESLTAGGVRLAAVQSIYVFGSLVHGRFSPSSDLDVLVVGALDAKTITPALEAVATMSGRRLDVVVMRSSEVEDRLDRNDSFIHAALGGLLVFGEPVR
jgi:predicted nucleotidyltransferase